MVSAIRRAEYGRARHWFWTLRLRLGRADLAQNDELDVSGTAWRRLRREGRKRRKDVDQPQPLSGLAGLHNACAADAEPEFNAARGLASPAAAAVGVLECAHELLPHSQ